MTIRRIVWAILLLVIAGQAWALYDLTETCNRRSGLRTLSLGVQSLMREGNMLHVADKVKFARDVSQQGIHCRHYGDRDIPSTKSGVIRCWEDETSGGPSIVHFYADFSFEQDFISDVEEGVRKVFDYEMRDQP